MSRRRSITPFSGEQMELELFPADHDQVLPDDESAEQDPDGAEEDR